MEKEIKDILISIAIKLQVGVTVRDAIEETDDVEALAGFALMLLDKALFYKANCIDFRRLEVIFGYYSVFNSDNDEYECTMEKYKRLLLKHKGVYLDGNFGNNNFKSTKLKVLVSENDFDEILYDFYGSSSEIFHDLDRTNPYFSSYFFEENADAIVFDGKPNISMALITYVRRNDNKALVIKKFNKISYVEEEVPLELEKMYFSRYDISGNFIESYEKMYLDALKETGINAFLEVMSIVNKVNYKKVMAIRKMLFAKDKEMFGEVTNELRRTSGITISRG